VASGGHRLRRGGPGGEGGIGRTTVSRLGVPQARALPFHQSHHEEGGGGVEFTLQIGTAEANREAVSRGRAPTWPFKSAVSGGRDGRSGRRRGGLAGGQPGSGAECRGTGAASPGPGPVLATREPSARGSAGRRRTRVRLGGGGRRGQPPPPPGDAAGQTLAPTGLEE